jgi:hypothetical protein
MAAVFPARGSGAIFGLGLILGALPAAAGDQTYACQVISLIDISDTQPYAFTIRVDPDQRTIRDVDGDAGDGWITDVWTETRIEAHFDFPDRLGGLVLDRNAGTIDMITAFRTPRPEIGQWHGTCVPK